MRIKELFTSDHGFVSDVQGCHRLIDQLAICRPSGCTVVSGVVGVGVCNRSQSKCTCLISGVSIGIGLDPGEKCTKGIFDRSKFKVTRDISPTVFGWLLVYLINH